MSLKGFQYGHAPLGACLKNAKKKKCWRGHKFTHVTVDSMGKKHRICYKCIYYNRNMRLRKARADVSYTRAMARIGKF